MLAFKLSCCGAVQVKGPKWCGKSTTAERAAESAVFLQGRRTSAQQIELAKNAPELFLAGEAPRLIDEWQIVPSIWDDVRFEVDQRGENGQFILTGSATPLDDDGGEFAREHSGIGRITPLVMRTMTLYESEDATGGVSLASLFAGEPMQPVQCALSLTDYAYLVCRGGWPRALDLDRDAALEQAYIYFEGLVNDDINRVTQRARNPERVKRLLRSLARATAAQMSISEIRRDMVSNEGASLAEGTIGSYVNALERLFVVEKLRAWNPNLRSRTAIRTSDTWHFVDPSIGCAALGLGPADLLADLCTFGLFFESLCVRDLRVYAEALRGEVRHYRDSSGLESDAIVHLRNGAWAAIEVKLASQEGIDEGARHLLKLRDRVDAKRMGSPAFLAVLTASSYAYTRDDGVHVIPLGCLAP